MTKFAFILSILSITLPSCLDLSDGGQNTLIKESYDVMRNKKAILFLKESGATVGDSYQVMITDHAHILGNAEVGNTFIADTNHGATILDSRSISLVWVSNDTLLIEYDKKLRTFMQNPSVNRTTILYHPE